MRRDEIGRLLAALPRLVRLRGLRDAVAPLLALPDPPDGWSRDLPELDKEEVRLDAEARAVAREADELARELDGLVDDPAALARASPPPPGRGSPPPPPLIPGVQRTPVL